MFKRTRDGRPKRPSIIAGEPTPQFLSEKLIAELQGAVNAAQRKRMPDSHGKGGSGRGANSVASKDIATDPVQN
jgi:hypothetical protein